MSDQATATTEPTANGKAPARSPHAEAWRSIAQAHAAVSGRLQEALAQADFPPLPWYEVLGAIAETPERQMRMGDLAEALVISRGGLTKLVDRLVKAGLLERTFCATDRRVSYASLLPAGADLLEEMRPVIAGELDAAFSAKLSVAEAKAMNDVLGRVRAGACGNA
jgi:DNA-binding MarR family transcriptional regulator